MNEDFTRRHRGRWAFSAFLVAAAVVLGAAPASAHAILEQSAPVDGQELARAPQEVRLTFSESVGISPTSVRVLDAAGHRVDDGSPHHGVSGRQVVVGLHALARGSYVVAWHVVSADTHPVSGAFAFGIGVAAGRASASALSIHGSEAVGVADGVARFLSFTGLALMLGSVCTFLLSWREGVSAPGARRVTWAGATLLGAGGLGLLALQGPYGAALGLSSAWDQQLFRQTAGSRYGVLILIRLGLVALALLASRRATRRNPRVWLGIAAGLLVAATPTWGLADHQSVGGQTGLAVPLDAVHLVAVSTWVGGLAVIAACLLRTTRAGELAAVLPRFSRQATAAIVVIVATGAYATWREVGTVPAFTHTAYGRTLLIKLAAFTALASLGYAAHRWVRRRARAAASDEVAPWLRRSLGAEASLGVAILAVAALLVNGVPARQAYGGKFAATTTAGPLTVIIDVSPTKTGPETMHLYTFDAQGRIATFQQLTASMSRTDGSVSGLPAVFADTGPGHATALGVNVPLPGLWDLAVTIRTTAIDEYTARVRFRVR